MANELVTFEQKVKEKLKETISDLIPEDRYQAIVEQTILEFQRADLPRLVREELINYYKPIIQAEFAKPEWQAKYNGSTQLYTSDKVKEMIIETAPLILANMFATPMNNLIQQLNTQIGAYRPY